MEVLVSSNQARVVILVFSGPFILILVVDSLLYIIRLVIM